MKDLSVLKERKKAYKQMIECLDKGRIIRSNKLKGLVLGQIISSIDDSEMIRRDYQL